jgi:flagellar hook-basal body complex protein FliE
MKEMNVKAISPASESISIHSTDNNNKEAVSFKDVLMGEINKVSELEKQSDALTADFISGKTDNIHSVLIAAEKASIAFELMIAIRDKVLDAYNEIMRMQV